MGAGKPGTPGRARSLHARPVRWIDGRMLDSAIRVLIVDDDEICREILQNVIVQQGVEVSVAVDGLDGLEKLTAEPFDILITDINMPRMDGLALLREARQRYPHILTIIITGYGSLESAIEAMRQGTYDYIQKPFKLDEIAITARNAVDKIKILRDKNGILEELEQAYRRLQVLERERLPAHEPRALEATEPPAEGRRSYVLFPRHTLPLAIFEKPAELSLQVLDELERLKELKQSGVITDKEFQSLKRKILAKINSPLSGVE
jgi:CheY-like chemotaxis protein